jgi:hypothetical protein
MSRGVVLDPFALRQFDSSKTSCLYHSPEEFAAKVEEYFTEKTSACLVDGYAPFCKVGSSPNAPNALLISPSSLPNALPAHIYAKFH